MTAPLTQEEVFTFELLKLKYDIALRMWLDATNNKDLKKYNEKMHTTDKLLDKIRINFIEALPDNKIDKNNKRLLMSTLRHIRQRDKLDNIIINMYKHK